MLAATTQNHGKVKQNEVKAINLIDQKVSLISARKIRRAKNR